MKNVVTREFKNAEEKGLTIYYNDSSCEYEIETPNNEIISFYDEWEGDHSTGEVVEEINNFIEEF